MPCFGKEIGILGNDMCIRSSGDRNKAFRSDPGVVGHMCDVATHIPLEVGTRSVPVASETSSSIASGMSRSSETEPACPVAPLNPHSRHGSP